MRIPCATLGGKAKALALDLLKSRNRVYIFNDRPGTSPAFFEHTANFINGKSCVVCLLLMANREPLSFAALGDIDRLSFTKAGAIMDEARKYLDALDYDLTVRRCQEAVELYLKSLCRFVQVEYPRNHDLGRQIYELRDLLKEYAISTDRIARLVLANAVLTLWRSPAFYGNEKLAVGNLFEKSEAALAVSYAELAQNVCGIAREFVYQRGTQ